MTLSGGRWVWPISPLRYRKVVKWTPSFSFLFFAPSLFLPEYIHALPIHHIRNVFEQSLATNQVFAFFSANIILSSKSRAIHHAPSASKPRVIRLLYKFTSRLMTIPETWTFRPFWKNYGRSKGRCPRRDLPPCIGGYSFS
jgi:hypothetical protein